MVGVGHEPQRQRQPGEHQRPGVQVGNRAPAGEADARHPVMEVLAVGGVDRAPVLQALEHDEGRVEERHGEQDQRQHEGDDGRRLDRRLDGDDAHQQAEQVGAAVAHEAGGGGKVVDQEAERRTGRDRRQHSGGGAVEVEGDHCERPGDDHAHARGQAVDAVGEVDDVHHHDQPDDGQHRPGVGRAGFGEMQRAGERERHRLHRDAVVHDDHRRPDLADELHQRRQVEAVVQRADDRDHGGGDQHAVPQIVAFGIAGRQEGQHRNHDAREDRKAAEQRRGATGESALARFVHGADDLGQPHRQRRQQRRHGASDQEGIQRVDLFEMRHLNSDSIAGGEALARFSAGACAGLTPHMCGVSDGACTVGPVGACTDWKQLEEGACADVNYRATRALNCS